MALAAIYPPALKVAATWFGRGHGLALATLIAALTAGSALPHSLRGLAVNVDWRMILGACSVASLIGSLLFLLTAKNGPLASAPAAFDPTQFGAVLHNRPLLLATLGYLGHMWELYAMWAWFLAYLALWSLQGRRFE